ncbi:MAG: HD domain-containing protein [Rhodoplanes sp.]|uniref:HD domain-containing protein n=1 Tax=Rhodoplanes sp. TaxID=1968906 RepID=UPI001797029F|nr:HD domain-containing protein [Rhodoplanes sp.]NVO13833.1 HD domain-containing protein [Rhodoplanes sp.]
MTDLVNDARIFAHAAHAAIGQRRKYTHEPYALHPAAVAALVESVPHTPEMVAAAWLHDVVEDTQVSLSLIVHLFGGTVARYVDQLTKRSKPEDGNRAVRMAIDLEHLAKADPRVKTVKLADLIDNTRSIAARDPEFWKVYREEKRALLRVLTMGDAVLWCRAMDQVYAED